ncbi:MAG: Zn-dependent alcohol dehydrogenase [bacterium]|nr:alcohol dehydrogenase [Deltaproteobacteria bacterium]MCP4904007.1 Zn-dependent alcohol dehydrogenase [bacterium]
MRAAVLTEVNESLEIMDLETDKPRANEVLIRTATAGVCHSDLHFQEGKYPCECPTVLGHEASGVVEAVGSDVNYVAPGDHVITCVSMSCGDCRQCFRGNPHLCAHEGLVRAPGDTPRLSRKGDRIHQFNDLSCYAEQMLVHEKAIVKITEDLPLDKAALLGCSVVTGVGAVQRTAKVGPGDTIAVVGCGGIGLNAIQGARIAGAERVIAVDRLSDKLELSRVFGATDTVDASEVDAVGTILELTRGGVDHAIEAVGLKQTAEQCFNMLGVGGTATVIGMIPIGTTIELQGVALLAERKIQGSVMGSTRFRIDMPMYANLYLQGRLKLDELVSRTLRLDEINEGFEALRRGDVARSIINF